MLRPHPRLRATTVALAPVECLAFFKRQLEIVDPRIVVALGGDSFDRIKRLVPGVRKVYHPSWREFRWQRTRAQRIAETGEALRAIVNR